MSRQTPETRPATADITTALTIIAPMNDSIVRDALTKLLSSALAKLEVQS